MTNKYWEPNLKTFIKKNIEDITNQICENIIVLLDSKRIQHNNNM